jgi:hypothetical protein
MAKKPEKTYLVPKEVQYVPPELKDKIVLTEKQKKRDCAYRDKKMAECAALFGTAARLTPEEDAFAHASASVININREMERIKARLDLKRLPKGERTQLKKALLLQAGMLSDALFEQGVIDGALGILEAYGVNPHRQEYLRQISKAIERPDNEHCDCPPENKFVERKIYITSRRKWVELLRCACGHCNVTEKLPAPVAALNLARAKAGTNDNDERVFALARKAQA